MQAEDASRLICRLTRHQKHTNTHAHTHAEQVQMCYAVTENQGSHSSARPALQNRGIVLTNSLLTSQLAAGCTAGCTATLVAEQLVAHPAGCSARSPICCPACWTAPACCMHLAARWAGKSLQNATAEYIVVSPENTRHYCLHKPAESTRRRICRK